MMGRFSRTRRGDFKVRLFAKERDLLRRVCEASRTTLLEGDPTDPVLRRLYPAASLDDPTLAAQVDDMIRDDLTQQRLEAIDRLEATVGEARVSSDDLGSWLAVCNDARLMIGVRIGVTEESSRGDFDGAEADAFSEYRVLTSMVGEMVHALSGITESGLLH